MKRQTIPLMAFLCLFFVMETASFAMRSRAASGASRTSRASNNSAVNASSVPRRSSAPARSRQDLQREMDEVSLMLEKNEQSLGPAAKFVVGGGAALMFSAGLQSLPLMAAGGASVIAGTGMVLNMLERNARLTSQLAKINSRLKKAPKPKKQPKSSVRRPTSVRKTTRVRRSARIQDRLKAEVVGRHPGSSVMGSTVVQRPVNISKRRTPAGRNR